MGQAFKYRVIHVESKEIVLEHVTINEVAKLFNCSTETIRRNAGKGKLTDKFYKVELEEITNKSDIQPDADYLKVLQEWDRFVRNLKRPLCRRVRA